MNELKQFVAERVWFIKQSIVDSEEGADVKREALKFLVALFNELKTDEAKEVVKIIKQDIKPLYEFVKPKE
jgi:hypothetical protein